jgi:hypothetical protein
VNARRFLRAPEGTAAPAPARRRTLLGLGAATLLAGCGGGTELAGVGSGGTGGQGPLAYSVGPITGFGSVIVNGIRFDDSTARVTDDASEARALSELGLGMIVEIEGTVDAATGSGTARAIRIVSRVRGTVGVIDAAAGRFAVLGTTVAVDEATVRDDDAVSPLPPAGETVEVWGFPDASTGVVRATRVERRDPGRSPAKLSGTVSGLDLAARRCVVDRQSVDLGGVLPLPAGLVDGAAATVWGPPPGADGVLRATRIQLDRPGLAPDVEQARIDGTVSGLVSAARFVVAGVPVDASGAEVSGGGVAGLRDGARVRVIGAVRDGVVVASTVEIRGAARGNSNASQGGSDANGSAGPGGSADSNGNAGSGANANANPNANPNAGAGTGGNTTGAGNGGANPGTPAQAYAEDDAQIIGVVSRTPAGPSALFVEDASGRRFRVDYSGANVVGGSAADLRAGTPVFVQGRRGGSLIAALIRIGG